MAKKKFKNNKRKLTFKEEYEQLINEFQIIHQLAKGVKLGEARSIMSTLYSKYRALLCSGTWTMDPLLIRIMNKIDLEVIFYSTKIRESEENTEGVLSQVFLAKQWSLNPKGSFSVKTKLSDYLADKAYFNPQEDRFISRNDLIKVIADSEGAHLDPDIDLYSELLNNSSSSFGNINITQKELLMWDIYYLLEMIMNQLEMFIYVKRKSLEKGSTLQEEYAKEKKSFDEKNKIYDSILTNPIMSEFKSIGYRTCPKCQSKLNKVDSMKFKCVSCKEIVEL